MTKTSKGQPNTTPERQRFERRAIRLRKEIDELEEVLFSVNSKDPQLRCDYLKTFRAEIIRSFVISLHLEIEDLLHAILFDYLAKRNRRLTKKETIRIVEDMRSSDLIHWCGRLNIVTPRQYRSLVELNRVRNACAHHWLLDLPRFRQVGPKGKRKRQRVPTVTYQNKDLFAARIFLDDFYPVYSRIYLKLLFRVWKMQGKL